MTTAEERMKILKMIDEGKISAQEGAQLLKALTKKSEKPARSSRQTGKNSLLRVRVTDMTTGKAKVNVNVPLTLMNAGLNIASQFAPAEMEDAQMMESIKEAISNDMRGKIVDVIDEEDKEHIEVFID
jgi:hypothetical protein